MAANKLRPCNEQTMKIVLRIVLRIVATIVVGLMLLLTVFYLPSCSKTPSVGLTLLFLNSGPEFIVVQRFDPDGKRGPVPGGLGPDKDERFGGAQMTFMPGDSQRPIPEWVEIQWAEHSPEFKAWADREETLPKNEAHNVERRALYEKAWATNPTYIKKIDLTGGLTSEIIARARENSKNTNIKLKVIFKRDKVSISAENEVWQ
jgi:hypothetical protein